MIPDISRLLGALPNELDIAVVRDGARTIIGAGVSDLVRADGRDALPALATIETSGGWWAGTLSYDLGRIFENVPTIAVDDLGLPDVTFARFEARLVLEPGRAPRIEGAGSYRDDLRRALEQDASPLAPVGLTRWTTSLDRDDWIDRIAMIHELLRAGEVYQVNLTRRLTSPTPADPRALFASLQHTSPAPHGALIDLRGAAGLAIASASPERFLARQGRWVETRPIKGTHRDGARLAASAKNRAENIMIVDLARNDLGRVCEPGSIDVPDLCLVERHPGLVHLVSTVLGELRADVGLSELIAATFPPASVTGAPKPRVLRAIEELEPVRRGLYCGAMGWIDAARSEMDLSVAIRTFVIASDSTHLGVGAGIVADSDAVDEWDETNLKSHRLLAAAAMVPGMLV